mmetsp:Transcript_149610/g.480202  ORF Transcript_149610/g.480202 Transcript_149610/m.480202 type:complete len:609 (+) Transcript_149610:2046-3872(+)
MFCSLFLLLCHVCQRHLFCDDQLLVEGLLNPQLHIRHATMAEHLDKLICLAAVSHGYAAQAQCRSRSASASKRRGMQPHSCRSSGARAWGSWLEQNPHWQPERAGPLAPIDLRPAAAATGVRGRPGPAMWGRRASGQQDQTVSAADDCGSGGSSPSGGTPQPRPGVPKPLKDPAVSAFLKPYGFRASSAKEWQGQASTLSIRVYGHSVIRRHTYYHLDCTLAAYLGSTSPALLQGDACWQCGGRLRDIRVGLHDLVKRELGRTYSAKFAGIPFARRLRPSGTTARLDAWFRQLAQLVTSRALSPAAVAATLRFLGAPMLDGQQAVEVVMPEHAVRPLKSAAALAAAQDADDDEGGSSDSDLEGMLATLSAAESAYRFGSDHASTAEDAALATHSSAASSRPSGGQPPPPLPPPASPPASPRGHSREAAPRSTGEEAREAAPSSMRGAALRSEAAPRSVRDAASRSAREAAPVSAHEEAAETGWSTEFSIEPLSLAGHLSTEGARFENAAALSSARYSLESVSEASSEDVDLEPAAEQEASSEPWQQQRRRSDSELSDVPELGVGMLQRATPTLLPDGLRVGETKLQTMLRMRREKVEPQHMSGRGTMI